ncbi:bifunctional riboflavin kinase/FAD synthetase [soil metagenome]
MRFFNGLQAVPAGFGPSAVAVGKFDGIHLGHRGMLAQLHERADAAGLTATVVTFDRNPLSLLQPEKCPPNLVSNPQKVELLGSADVDATVMVEFTLAFSGLDPEEFVKRVLVDALDAKLVLAGDDFRFGSKGKGDLGMLREYGEHLGFEVVAVDDVHVGDESRRVSSTWIREALADGDVRTAARLLGRLPSVRSRVVHGEQRGRELGYPTANLDPDIEGLLPVDAVYAAWAYVDGERYGAAVSIGNNPTFDGIPQHQVEAHLLDQKLDLYGRDIELAFVERIRPMRKFDSVESLVEQLQRDEQQIREVLAAEAG